MSVFQSDIIIIIIIGPFHAMRRIRPVISDIGSIFLAKITPNPTCKYYFNNASFKC